IRTLSLKLASGCLRELPDEVLPKLYFQVAAAYADCAHPRQHHPFPGHTQSFLASLERLLLARSPAKARPPSANVSESQFRLIVVFLPQVRNQIRAHHPAQRVLQLHGLDEQVMFGIQPRRGHGRLEVEAQPRSEEHTS